MSDKSLTLSARQTADFELLANGGFAPLKGFMGSADWKSSVENMTLADGEEVWPIPVTLATDLEVSEGDVVALSADNGKALGRIRVSEIFERDVEKESEHVYRTTDDAHPGVAATKQEGNRCIAGEIEADATPDHEEAFMRRYFTPAESRKEFADRGWKRIVAFQTRNPIHRAHEYLTKAALEVCDGLFLHPLIGETKKGDIPADVRMKCYEVLMDNYYPHDRVVLGVNPAAMRYAGPREAIFHALVRRNYGATHFIVGRDHAGVGDYYGTYDAQAIFDEIDIDKLGHPSAQVRAHVLVSQVRGHGLQQDLPARRRGSPLPERHEGPRDARQRRVSAARVLPPRGRRDPDRVLQVSRKQRDKEQLPPMSDHKGFTLWMTGLSGSGKSTITEVLIDEFDERGLPLEVLDGDVVREHLSKGLGFSKEDRDTNIGRIAFVADLLSRNGVPVITAAISPYRATRRRRASSTRARPVRRGLRRHLARGLRGPRHQGPLRQGALRRDQGVHRASPTPTRSRRTRRCGSRPPTRPRRRTPGRSWSTSRPRA